MTTGVRRGVVIVPVIVGLIIIGSLGTALIRTGLAERRRAELEERRLQADWLAESGLERAAAALGRSAEYAGETWTIPADQLGGRRAGRVEIVVEPVPGAPGRRAVRVRADYPADSDSRARQTRRIELEVGPGPASTDTDTGGDRR